MYFRDAEKSGTGAVSLPYGVINRQIINEAHRHGLCVFSRLEHTDQLTEVETRGIDGIITDDPELVYKRITFAL